MHRHLLIESAAHLVFGPPPDDPRLFWPSLDDDDDGSSHCGSTSNDDSSTDDERSTSLASSTLSEGQQGCPHRPALQDIEPHRDELLERQRRRHRHHHRHQYHSLRHPWIWGIIEPSTTRESIRHHDNQQQPSQPSSPCTISTTGTQTVPHSKNDWLNHVSHFSIIAKPKTLGVWPPSRPKPHECLPPKLYYSLVLTAYGTSRTQCGNNNSHDHHDDDECAKNDQGETVKGYRVLKQWIIPFVHRLGDGHDDAGSLTTRLCEGSTGTREGQHEHQQSNSASQPTNVPIDHHHYHSENDDDDDEGEYDGDEGVEDDDGAFITRRWKDLSSLLTSISASSTSNSDLAPPPSSTKETRDDISLYVMIRTLQTEDNAASRIQQHFLEPITQTKQAALPGFEEYWLETLHEYGFRGLAAVRPDQSGSNVDQVKPSLEVLDWSRSPFCYGAADLRILLPC